MDNFCTTVIIDNNPVQIRELKLKHYKTLQKALLGAEEDFNTLIVNFTNVLENITSLGYKELLNLNYIEYCKLLFYIRSISMGNIIKAHTTDENSLKIEINIDNIIVYINKLNFKQFIQPLHENIPDITFKIPTIEDILNSTKISNPYLISFLCFVNFKEPIFNETSFNIFYENLPTKLFLSINEHFKKINTYIDKINLLEYLNIKDRNITLPLTYNISNIISILQLLFSTNLSTLYENTFALSKMANMSPLYLEECTPGEYNLYVGLLQAILKTQNTSKVKESLPPINKEAPNFM